MIGSASGSVDNVAIKEKHHTEDTMMMTEKKTMMELDQDALGTVSGGEYTVDESIPEVQAFINECKSYRQSFLTNGVSLTSQYAADFMYGIFVKLECYKVLKFWEMQDIMEKYFYEGIFYPRYD